MTILEQRHNEFWFAVTLYVWSIFLFASLPFVWRPLFQVTLGMHGVANLYLAIRTYRLIRTNFSPCLSSLLSVVVCILPFNVFAFLAIPLILRLPTRIVNSESPIS